MKKNNIRYLILLVLPIFFIFTFILLIKDSQSNLTLNIKSKIPKNVRMLLKDSINFYLNNFGVKFKKINPRNVISSQGSSLIVNEFKNNLLDYQGPRSYFDLDEKNIFLISGTGIIFKTEINNITNLNNEIIFDTIDTNIKSLIKYKDFYRNSNYGVKGFKIIDGYFYVSFSNFVEKDCINISVIKGKIINKKIDFKYLFNPGECVKKKNSYREFQPIQSGGAIYDFDEESLIMSTGEFRFRDLAQDKNSLYGKILRINKEHGSTKIISMGHRNVQGLYYDKNKKIIVSTEHGPMGGDEININKKVNDKTNFGWPISSYGEHYPKMAPKDAYEKAPLFKSHDDYGFQEPIKYFVPSIGITQIVKARSENDDESFFYGSMGYADREKSHSIHKITFNSSYDKIEFEDQIKLNARVRDLKYINSRNLLFAYLEKKGSIILINFNE